jgi:hypothetical protein
MHPETEMIRQFFEESVEFANSDSVFGAVSRSVPKHGLITNYAGPLIAAVLVSLMHVPGN